MKKILRKLREIKLFLLKKVKKRSFLDVDYLVCYICGNEALPLPLDNEEERILLEELSNGNERAKEKSNPFGLLPYFTSITFLLVSSFFGTVIFKVPSLNSALMLSSSIFPR